MVSAETVDGGKLREAATMKADESILIQINNKDMVALEVKYHRRCYEKYTSFLRHKTQSNEKEPEKHECKYEQSFDVFCKEFVNERLIKQDNIFYMSKLRKEFIKTVRRVENEDALGYRSFRLKKRLRKRFPQLVFHRPKLRSRSEIVYTECLSRASVAESFIDMNEETSQSSLESDSAVQTDGERYANMNDSRASLKELYTVGMALKSVLQDQPSTWYNNWPPLASDITAENVKKLVCPRLFNFMAWFLGFSDEPEDAEYIALEEKTTAKIFSLCQDLVYVANKGKVQTPKSLALAMAVRQMSGCSGIINILNGFGHCVSLSSTMAYDSAIAQATINTSNILPREFIATEYVNLVYDNIDFGEEIDKQTHVTNGIITQKVSVQKQLNSSDQPASIKKTQRTVKMPLTDIVPYSVGVKMTPAFQRVKLDPECLTVLLKNNSATTAHKLDLAYILTKYICSSNEEILPGWTGFNTILCGDKIPDVSRVGYLPVIDASPTEYSTINTILTRSKEIADKLELKYAVLVFDEAVYAKIQHVRWKEKTFFNRFVVRLGEFHTIMSYLSAMSKIFEDGGLKVKSRTFAVSFFIFSLFKLNRVNSLRFISVVLAGCVY